MKTQPRFLPRSAWLLTCFVLAGLFCGPSSDAADAAQTEGPSEAKRHFDIPAGGADRALKVFSEQARRGVIYSTDALKDVRTNAVQGDFTPSEALSQLVGGTGLVVTKDANTGAFAVRKEAADPNSGAAAPVSTNDRRRGIEPGTKGRVTGSNQSLVENGSPGRGNIVGRVSNRATRANLAQARVALVEVGREALTERDGSFAFTDLAPGRYSLVVDYPGLDQMRTAVDVAAGGAASVDLALGSDVYEMSAFVVAGQREGYAAAVAEQRHAANVTSIITADAFGDITKANIGNIIRRIPGVAGYANDEIDTSEVMVRGMAANLTSIDIDGTRALSPAGRATRAQNVSAIPVDMIGKIEVTKAPLAEDDADSLGGRVKLTTKSAFDLNERLINMRVGASYNQTYGKDVSLDGKDYIPLSVGITFSDVLGLFGQPRRLGILVTASYDKSLDARSSTEFLHGNSTGGNPSATQTRDYSQFRFASVDLHQQERMSGSVRLEYRIGEHTTLGVSTLISQNNADYDRARMGANPGTIDTALSDPDPGVTVVNNASYMGFRDDVARQADTYNLRGFGTSQFGGYKFVYDVNKQRAERFTASDRAQFNSNRRFSYTFDWRPNPEFPSMAIRSGLDPFSDRFADTASTSIEVRRATSRKQIWASRLEVEKPYAMRFPVRVKAGLRYREESQVEDSDRFIGTVASAVGRNLAAFLDENWRTAAANGQYPIGALPSTDKLLHSNVTFVGGLDPRTAWRFDPNLLTMNAANTVQQSLKDDSKLVEALYAGFLQGSVKIGRLTTQGGARYELTDLRERHGLRNRAASDLLLQWGGVRRASTRYDDIFPSVHLRYDLPSGFVMRAALSTTIGRPDMGTLASDGDIDTVSRSISVPNPDLKPQRSTNYDLSLEYYLRPAGVISVGGFEKDIRDGIGSVSTTISEVAAADFGAPIASPRPDALTWTLTTQQNNKSTRVRGLEFNYWQQLDFLPGKFPGARRVCQLHVARVNGLSRYWRWGFRAGTNRELHPAQRQRGPELHVWAMGCSLAGQLSLDVYR